MRRGDRIAGFDGIRAIAFLLVFVSHKVPLAKPDPYGDVGVWIFFVLSGFLITRILAAAREEVEAGRIGAGWALARFYLRRTVRIFPVYYLVLFVFVFLSLQYPIENFYLKQKLAYFLYATNIYIGRSGWVGDFSHLWTLAIEEQFYLLLAPLALFVPRRFTAWLCLGFVTVALATKLAMEAAHASWTPIDVSSLINFGLLGLGGLVGLAAPRVSAPSWLTSGWAQAASAACLLAAPVVFGPETDPWHTYAKLLGLVAALFVFQVARGQGSWFVAGLNLAPLRLLGRISYGAYLFHHFIHFEMFADLPGIAGAAWAQGEGARILAELAATIVLATLSWLAFERPILEWGARLSRSPPFSPAAAPEARGQGGDAEEAAARISAGG